MIVEYLWPDCDQIGGEQLDPPVDAFWVECTPDELNAIRPSISTRAEPRVYPAMPCWWRDGTPLMHFFLVSRDGRLAWPQSREVLHSSQWHTNPFRQLPAPVIVRELHELALIARP